MEKIAILLKAMNLYGHNLHNLIKGDSFFADHEKVAEFYTAADVDYDGVIERMIGQGKSVQLVIILEKAVRIVKMLDHSGNAKMGMKDLLRLEKDLCRAVEQEVTSTSISEGAKQLIGEIANQSETRQYMLMQRLK